MIENAKHITHSYGVELDWMEGLAQALGGYIQNERIISNESTITGTLYGCSVNNDLSAFYQEITYNSDVNYKLRNTSSDFVGIYFNLTEGDFVQVVNKLQKPIGRWAYNVAVIDSILPADYLVKGNTKSFSISIFIKKEALLNNLSKMPNFDKIKDVLFDAEQNTLIRFERASNKAWFLMNELRKMPIESMLFKPFFIGTVYGLIGDYLDQIIDQEIVLDKVTQEDIEGIIGSQSFLIENIQGSFPGLKTLSASANMSYGKFKQLFKKITGSSAKAFFLTNKLDAAKEMLDTGDYTISEVAEKFSFFDASHFIELFKKRYDLTPKEYQKYL